MAPAAPRFIGHSTWTSRTGSRPKRRGMRSRTSASTRSARALGVGGVDEVEVAALALRRRLRHSPALTRCAAATMRLSAACRNTVGQPHHRHDRLRRHQVGEHLSRARPTAADRRRRRAAARRCAAPRARARASAARRPSTSRRRRRDRRRAACRSSRRKRPSRGFTSSSRWIVCASSPVDLGEALGGAAGRRAEQRRARAWPSGCAGCAFSSVVLPTPGPPVITSSFERSASATAARCSSASAMPSCALDPGKRPVGVDGGPRRSRRRRSPCRCSRDGPLGGVQAGEEDAASAPLDRDRARPRRPRHLERERLVDQRRSAPAAASPPRSTRSRLGQAAVARRPAPRRARSRCRRGRGSSPSSRCRASPPSGRR